MSGFTISSGQIAEAEAELSRLDKAIEDTSRRRNALRDYVRAARLLQQEGEEEAAPTPPAMPETLFSTDEQPNELEASNLQGTIEHIANESPQPVSRAMMKIKLKQAGITHKRVHGSYFYVAVERLKKRGRISVLPDGTLWRADPQ